MLLISNKNFNLPLYIWILIL